MSAAHYNLLGHVAKRGLAAAQGHFTQMPSPEVMSQLQEQSDKTAPISNAEFLPIIITGIITLLVIASIRYTIGDVMATLCMIESPSSTAIIEPKGDAPPPYSDEHDAPLEKEPLMMDNDVEITLINHKPITAKITTTIGHLQRTGGFFSRWRGAGISVLYHFVHGAASNLISSFLGMSLFGNALVYIFVSIATARIHALWTHSIIAQSSKPWYKRFISRRSGKALLLPSLVFAAAQQATFLLPLSVAFVLDVPGMHNELASMGDRKDMDCGVATLMALRFIAVPATAFFVAMALLMPAAVTLTRIEATLLAEDEQTIVPFDRQAIMENVDLSVRGGARTLFLQAWRSFDSSARLRLIKVYIKMGLAQFTVGMIGLHLAVAELYFIGTDRLVETGKGVMATFQLAALEAQQNAQNVANAQIN